MVHDRIADLDYLRNPLTKPAPENDGSVIQIPQQIIFVCASSAFIELPLFFWKF
jgi:hypothetical protein